MKRRSDKAQVKRELNEYADFIKKAFRQAGELGIDYEQVRDLFMHSADEGESKVAEQEVALMEQITKLYSLGLTQQQVVNVLTRYAREAKKLYESLPK